MSAYVVEDETIDRILSYLQANASYVEGVSGLGNADSNTLTAFGRKLLYLNTQAVNQRYSTDNECYDASYNFKQVAVGAIQASKSLACLIYQCSEGDVPDTELFKLLEQVEGEINGRIVRALPEWDQGAVWG